MSNDGGPAFPSHGDAFDFFGLSKREYFAGLAMQALIASGHGIGSDDLAVRHADALLAELAKEGA